MHIISFIDKQIGKKIEQKINGWNHHKGDKKGRPKKGQKTNNPQEFLKRERTSPFHGRKLFHP
jgi:hypothetical protein